MYISQNYYNAIAAGTRPVLSGALGIYSITEDDIMEGSFQIDEAMESLPIGGIVTSCLTLVLNNFEGKFDPSLLTTSTVMSLTMTVGTETLTLPNYHIVDKKVADNTIMLTLMDMTDTLATPPSINSPITGATWADVVDDILDRFSMTYDTDTAAATKLAGAASVPVIYGQDTYKSVLLHILQYLNLFARISSGSELYIFYPDPEATPIPVTEDMVASIDAEGPHTPTAVSIKAFNGEEYVTSGTSGYTATLEGCPLIVGTPDPSGYLTEVSELSFYNFNLDCIGDPSVQIGDYIEIGGSKLCLVGTKSYKYGGYANLGFKWDIDTVDDFSYAVNTEVDPAVAEQVDDARKVATNYLSSDSSGIMVADLADGAQTPSAATGRNVFIDNYSVDIRDGQTVLASFGETVVLGDQSASGNYAVIDNDSFDIYHGNTEMTHFGYGEGNAVNGIANAPYFSIGSRKTTTTPYNSSSTYVVGDLCVYNDKLYVCNTDITTPEAWDSSHWMLIIGNFSVAEGRNTTASGDSAHAEGIGSIAINHDAHAEGRSTIASGLESHAEGYQAIASQVAAHAEGYQTTASGARSHAEGYQTTASSEATHAEGYQTTASGTYSHAEGEQAVASGNYGSHAEGQDTTASGSSSHAEGFNTTASGQYSHAGGNSTTARTKSQTVIGEYNILDTAGSAIAKGDYAFIIGNGTSNNARSNALTVDWDGNVNLSGTLTLPLNKYKASGGGIDCRNCDIINFGAFYGADVAGTAGEGILFYRDGTYWDGIFAKNGVLYFAPNYTSGDANTKDVVVAHSGNIDEVNCFKKGTYNFGTVGTGYTTGTSGTVYVFLDLHRLIPSGATLTLNSLTGVYIRGVNGLIINNQTVSSNVTIARQAGSGKLRLMFTGQTTNWKANSPVHFIGTVNFTIS